MSTLHAAIILPFLLAAGVPLLKKLPGNPHPGWAVLLGPAVLFIYFLRQIPLVQSGNGLAATVPWISSLGIDFTVLLDGLSLLFALLISGIGTLVVLYSIFYMSQEKEAVYRFSVYLLLFMGAMLGVVLSDNLIVLYGFWELTSISSFLLIAFWHHRERSRYGAFKSMLITVFGGLAMLAGFVLIYIMTGTFSVREIIQSSDMIIGHSLMLPALLLVLLGAFTKSAQFPFHIWLPDAMEAPTPVSAYLHSATMVKAGLYLVARFTPVFSGQAAWFWLVSGVGLVTLIFGSFKAIKQTDLKAMLAFSTISQLGLIMALLGLGSASGYYTDVHQSLFYSKATMAAIFHLMNHAVFKGALFMVVGIVDHETGTRDIRKLGGLMRLMPVTFSVAAIGTLSMAGIPPFGGFLSKEMFFTAILNTLEMGIWSMDTWSTLFPLIAWTASVFTFAYSMVLLYRTFAGKFKPEQLTKQPHEAPAGMLVPPVVLAALALVFGLFPGLLSYSLIEPAMAAILPDLLAPGEKFLVSIQFWHGWTPEVFMTLGVIAAGVLVVAVQPKLKALNSPWFARFSLNGVYDTGLRTMERSSQGLTNKYMTGSVRHYLIYIFTFFVLALGAIMLAFDGFSLDSSSYAPVTVYEAAILLALIIAAIAVPFANSRLLAIILTGAVGYMVSLFFVIFRAPDLALTQLIVETVSVTLFLLCFYHLPKLKKELSVLKFKLANFLVSLGVGAMVTLIALSALSEGSSHPFESISKFFLEASYTLAGGKNVVNVILVDFRGFDTMLEIVVLGIASLGIFALIRLNLDESHEPLASRMSSGKRQTGGKLPAIRSNDVILRMTSRVAMFIILTFSLYLFFAGHNNPGGGFIGGLMTSAALVLLAIAYGQEVMRSIVPLDFRKVMASGLFIAFLTGLGSLWFGVPFLSHAFGHAHLSILGEVELATAVIFDLGVYLTVVGVTMTIILEIGRDR
ncbi:Na+/H+ antiporter subunit A [Paenibacillus woosongensis]|uniref:Na+/H+ antiporter subunit A n=1 Tax=Paenibacillus woosongensis TaxID=307580 RepID=A0AA95IAL5_9BACL|nr:Na+/H+ antiporter subunit A [Paenibacillus woosongensis]WHX48393.1 Na+/H+ antiporter subunit A [Paenibacillus woosongensis]